MVEGSVVRPGNCIRITAQLVHAASDEHLWAQAFERDVHDVLVLYADMSELIRDVALHRLFRRSEFA